MSFSDAIEVYGSVKQRTAKAVRFHIGFHQPRSVPDSAAGKWLWFPRRACVVFRDASGQVVLHVSRRLLLEKIAEAESNHVQSRQVA